MTLDERIREQRKSCGLSQEKLAELMGVSRQAVTKWETGQSAPSTENLFRLAEILGTTVDLLLDSGEEKNSLAEQIYYLYKMEEEKKAATRRARGKKRLLMALAVLGGFLALYLLCRIFCTVGEGESVMGWLFGVRSQQLTYLFGWLLRGHLFLAASILCAVTALLGKYRVSFTALGGFAMGLLLGELLGENPDPAPFAPSHYGWLIWGCVFLLSIIVGMVLERRAKGGRGKENPSAAT